MSTATNAALTAARSRLAIRRALATTPGRLRLAGALLAVGAILFGVLAAHAAGTRGDAVKRVAKAERLLTSAAQISTSLSDAHATAANSFLLGGAEPTGSRLAYVQQLKVAGLRIGELAGEIGTSGRGGSAVQRITSGLAVYPGLIDEARANNRQGLPVGSAYLRQASTTLRSEMLPSAHELYRIQALDLRAGYEAGVSTWSLLAVILTASVLLVLLAAAQIYLARTTRRILNPPLALATFVLLALVAWIVVAFAQQHDSLVRAQSSGSDALELLTATRILASRAQTTDQSIALFALGGGEGEPDPEDVDRAFEAVTRPIGAAQRGPVRGDGGLLRAAAEVPGTSAGAIAAIDRSYRAYLAAHRLLLTRQREGRFDRALEIAVGAGGNRGSSTKVASAKLNGALDGEIEASRRRFARATRRAEARLGGLELAIPLGTGLCALLALLGVRERLEEYR